MGLLDIFRVSSIKKENEELKEQAKPIVELQGVKGEKE